MGDTAAVSLTCGTLRITILASPPGQPPLLVADIASAQTMTQDVPEMLWPIDTLVAANSDSLHGTLANLNKFSQERRTYLEERCSTQAMKKARAVCRVRPRQKFAMRA